MFLIIRRILNKLLPLSLKYSLVRKLPNIEIFFAKSLRGIDKLWKQDTVFVKCYNESKKRSLLDVKKAYILFLCAKNAVNIEGDYAELGVFKGAGSKLMLEGSFHKKKILLFDTFEGLPDVNKEFDNHWDKGSLGDVSFNEIKTFLKEDNFTFYKGYFPESANNLSENTKFSFVHIDFDIYQSTLDALEYCYNKMSHNGIILIDDYGVLACPGVKKAVDDFFIDKSEMIIPNLNGQCIIIKA
ncbi:MAG: class I SAM-dependent methyltransferase [Bacteroidia bacterium]|nr:class I SAM-dependent methyltransferase [Bacteroidia bacterium]